MHASGCKNGHVCSCAGEAGTGWARWNGLLQGGGSGCSVVAIVSTVSAALSTSSRMPLQYSLLLHRRYGCTAGRSPGSGPQPAPASAAAASSGWCRGEGQRAVAVALERA